jgi:hypothetical protein
MKRTSPLTGALIGLLFASATPALARPTANDPLAGDARLSAKRSIRELSLPVRDVLADLNEQTGIAFFADPAVADDKITVIAHDRPVAETLRGISTFLRCEWTRSGKSGEFGYTLRVGPAEITRRAQAREDRLARLADLATRQAAAYGVLNQLTDSQRDAVADSLPQKIAEAKDPVQQQTLRIQSAVLREIGDRNRYRPFIYRLLAALTKEECLSMLRAGAATYAWPDAPGCKPLPSELVRALQQTSPIEGIGSAPGDILSLRARFTVVEGRTSSLRWELVVGRRNFYLSGLAGILGSFPPEVTDADAGPDCPLSPPEWEKDPKLSTNVTLDLPADERPAGLTDRVAHRPRSHKLSSALEQIDKALPIDVIADALWSTQIAGANMAQIPVGEALTRLARTTGHRWWKQDGFIMIRSLSYDADREAEPPSLAVSRWISQYDRGLFDLDDLAEVAALPYNQAVTLQDMGMRGAFLMLISPLSNGRSHLQFWNSLSLPQRRKATKSGIGFAELSSAQQSLYVMAASDTSSPVRAAVLDEKVLARSRMRIETRQASLWGVRRATTNYGPLPRVADAENGNSISRDEAWRRYQGVDSSIQREEVQPMVKSYVAFICEDDRGLLSHIMIDLPPRWEE